MEHHYRIGAHVSYPCVHMPALALGGSTNSARYAYAPLFILFEKEPPMPDENDLAEAGHSAEAANTALLIPCVCLLSCGSVASTPVYYLDRDPLLTLY